MELTDIVTVKLTNEGAHLLTNYTFAAVLYVELKNEELIDKMIFYEGDEYKTLLWKLIELFGRDEFNIRDNRLFTDLQKAKE